MVFIEDKLVFIEGISRFIEKNKYSLFSMSITAIIT